MNDIWQERFHVKSYEVDFNKKLKLNCLFNFMQEAAYNHATSLGAGYEALTEHELLWVLSRVKIALKKYPLWDDNIKIETWPKGVNKLFALRDFIFYDSYGEKIGSGTSAWLLLDSKKMRPQKIQSLPVELPYLSDRHGINEDLQKLDFQFSLDASTERIVTYSDIDVNNHLNNARYVEWILDCFSPEELTCQHISSLQINFLSEAKFGERIFLNKGHINAKENSSYIEGIDSESQAKIFQSKIQWSVKSDNPGKFQDY